MSDSVDGIMADTAAEARRRRLAMRAHRRGIREMDLILGPFATSELVALDAPTLDLFESLLDENDHDLYAWIAGRIGRAEGAGEMGPAGLRPLLDRIAGFAAAQQPVVRGA